MSTTNTRQINGVTAAFAPSHEFRFFLFDPSGFDFLYFRSPEDRNKAAEEVISAYLDDGWNEEVERVIAGEITHICEKINVVPRPDQVDEDGLDGEGDYWAEEWDCKCDYGLIPVPGEADEARHDQSEVQRLLKDYRSLLVARRFPDNDEGDFGARIRDQELRRIDAAIAAKECKYE